MRIAPRSVVADIVAGRVDPINAFGILQRFPNAELLEFFGENFTRVNGGAGHGRSPFSV